MLAARGLSTNGMKETLKRRLASFNEPAEEGTPPQAPDTMVGKAGCSAEPAFTEPSAQLDGGATAPKDPSSMTAGELRRALQAKGLSTNGKKAQLLRRLEAAISRAVM